MTAHPSTASSRILILDFGAQYSQLIARRVREAHVYCELVPADVSIERIRDFSPTGVILSGGPSSVLEPDSPDMLSLIHISEPTRQESRSRMPSSA